MKKELSLVRPNDSCVRVCLGSDVACTSNLYHGFIDWGLIIKKKIAYVPYKSDDFVDSRIFFKFIFRSFAHLRSD